MSATEAAGAKGVLAGPLAEGVETLSQSQAITFTKYVRSVNPLDGSVFWIKADIATPPAPPYTRVVHGSLHYSTDQVQREDETFGMTNVVFTSLSLVDDFQAVDPAIMWLGTFEGVRFSFGARRPFYKQADLHHYVGEGVYPAFATQIIDDPADIDNTLVVTNSLPMWLQLTGAGFLDDVIPVYPSYLVGDNIKPPYVAVHIDPAGTQTFSAAPVIDAMSNHWQLARDRVRLTIYGLRNKAALDYIDYVLGYMGEGDTLGLMNMPTARDEKRTQNEITALAMKKTVEFEVSYYQQAAANIARQLILHAKCPITVV